MTERTGGCLCGAVRYRLTAAPVQTMLCHCKNCQKTSGSAVSTIALMARDAVEIEGETKTYAYAGDSGRTLAVRFCPTCGSPVFVEIHAMPDMLSVKVGTLDDTSWFKPAVQIWTDSAQDWFPVPGDCPGFAKNSG